MNTCRYPRMQIAKKKITTSEEVFGIDLLTLLTPYRDVHFNHFIFLYKKKKRKEKKRLLNLWLLMNIPINILPFCVGILFFLFGKQEKPKYRPLP